MPQFDADDGQKHWAAPMKNQNTDMEKAIFGLKIIPFLSQASTRQA